MCLNFKDVLAIILTKKLNVNSLHAMILFYAAVFDLIYWLQVKNLAV